MPLAGVHATGSHKAHEVQRDSLCRRHGTHDGGNGPEAAGSLHGLVNAHEHLRNAAARAEWSTQRTSETSKRAANRRAAMPVPHPKSTTWSPFPGANPRAIASSRAASHFQPIRAAKTAS